MYITNLSKLTILFYTELYWATRLWWDVLPEVLLGSLMSDGRLLVGSSSLATSKEMNFLLFLLGPFRKTESPSSFKCHCSIFCTLMDDFINRVCVGTGDTIAGWKSQHWNLFSKVITWIIYCLCLKTLVCFVSQNYRKSILSWNLRTEKEFWLPSLISTELDQISSSHCSSEDNLEIILYKNHWNRKYFKTKLHLWVVCHNVQHKITWQLSFARVTDRKKWNSEKTSKTQLIWSLAARSNSSKSSKWRRIS